MVLELCQTDIKFLQLLLNIISDRTIILSDKINEISLKTIRQQIMDFLIYEKELQKSNTVKLPYSKKSMAERLGIQRSSLSRELSKMRADGILLFDSKTITLLKG
jgi:CRP-like cAMP-binding protein